MVRPDSVAGIGSLSMENIARVRNCSDNIIIIFHGFGHWGSWVGHGVFHGANLRVVQWSWVWLLVRHRVDYGVSYWVGHRYRHKISHGVGQGLIIIGFVTSSHFSYQIKSSKVAVI